MLRRSGYLMWFLVGWLVSAAWPSAAWGQVQALPPNQPILQPPLLSEAAPDMFADSCGPYCMGHLRQFQPPAADDDYLPLPPWLDIPSWMHSWGSME